MGNCCTKLCGDKIPCDQTEDETKGLLHSSESKTSTKAGTEPCISPISEKGHEEEIKTEPDESIITKQPNVEAETPKEQSCYSSQIAVLQTDLSLASPINTNVEMETPEAPAEEARIEVVQEIQNIAVDASVDAPAEAVVSKLDIEGQHGSPERVDVAPAPTDEAGVSPISQDSTPATVKETPATETRVKETPVEKATSLEAEKSLEVSPEAHVADEKETLQTEEQPVSDITDVKDEEVHDTGEVSVTNSSTQPDSCPSEQSKDLDVTSQEPIKESTVEVEEKLSEDACSETDDLQKETTEASETQEYIKQVSSPVVDVINGLSPAVENGVVKDSDNLTVEIETHSDVTVADEMPSKEEPSQEQADVESEELSKPSAYTDSTTEAPEVMNPNQEENEKMVKQEDEAAEPTHNGLNSTSASEASSPVENNSESVAVKAPEIKDEEKSLEPQDGEEPEHQQIEEEQEEKEERKEKQEQETPKQEDEKEQLEEQARVAQENSEKQKAAVIFSSEKVQVRLLPVPSEGSAEEEAQKLDESADLYLGAEEIELGAGKDKPSKAVLELTIPGIESRSSLAPAVDLLAYSEREWKGNTAKSALIRKGYSEMSRSFSALKQVRGDNYCALRATLYQVLATSTKMPTWLQDEGFLSLPEVIEAQEHLVGGWVFPSVCTWGSEKDSVERLKYYLDLLKKKWQAASACEDPEEKQSLCERVFQGGEEEYGLLEALKFLMLAKAIELHGNMMADQEVPVFCWLLFARDTSENPQTLLANHLSQIGISGGVEQVEMFLLGYALQHTIQAFRLYMTDTVEFVTLYPDDHKQEWPCVCIVTEDDRHYNVPVRRAAQHQQ